MDTRRYVVCDIEATGLDSDRDLIEIALLTYSEGKITDVYETLINPLRPIPEFISSLTSITNRELRNAPKFYEVAEAVKSRLEGAIFVSHNTDFDLGLLTAKFQELGQEFKTKSICTLKTSQQEIPGLKNYNLEALCSFFSIKITQRHRAMGDARATLELFKELQSFRTSKNTRPLYLPHHEKFLKSIPSVAGLLYLKNSQEKVFRFEASANMLKSAKEILCLSLQTKELLRQTETLEFEVTGSALIAEYKKLLFCESPVWVIVTEVWAQGERRFKIRPYRKGMQGWWFFKNYPEAKKKLKFLIGRLREDTFIYREGEKSKEEIMKHNQKFDSLTREARFPTENLLLIGEGRKLDEKSLVLVRNGHVVGYGYSSASEEEINQNPESFLTKRFHKHLGVDLLTISYFRVLKNQKHKTEVWRTLAQLS